MYWTVGPCLVRAFAIAVFVRLARHCEVYSDVTSHANKELGTGSVNLCPFLTASASELIIHCPSNLAMGFHYVHIQSASLSQNIGARWGRILAHAVPADQGWLLRIVFPRWGSERIKAIPIL